MAFNDFQGIEFGICVNGDEGEELLRIPIDDSVRESLSEMYDSFYEAYGSTNEAPDVFQPSEKYANTEKLTIALDHENLESLRTLYGETSIQIGDVNLPELAGKIIYYFVIFRLGPRTKKVAVKRPSQFKALLNKKLIRFIDDTLQAIPDDVFKLDIDFDFIISRHNIEILHPTGFIFIANIDQEVQRRAMEATQALGRRVAFIDFDSIAPFVGTSKTAAKLIASIKSRDDLESTSQQKLIKICKDLGVNVRVIRGKIVPGAESMLDFLNILDRREYAVDVTTQRPEIYLAASRKKMN